MTFIIKSKLFKNQVPVQYRINAVVNTGGVRKFNFPALQNLLKWTYLVIYIHNFHTSNTYANETHCGNLNIQVN